MINNVCDKQKDQLLTRSCFVARFASYVNVRAWYLVLSAQRGKMVYPVLVYYF